MEKMGQTRRLSQLSPKTTLATVQEVEALAVTSWEGPGLRSFGPCDVH